MDDQHVDTDGYAVAWRRFWNACNLFQFGADFLPASRKGIEGRLYADIILNQRAAEHQLEDAKKEGMSLAWKEALDETFLKDSLRLVMEAGCVAPTIGVDVSNAQSEVIASLEWAWMSRKVGYGELSELELADLKKAGWQVFTTAGEDSIEELIKRLQHED